MKVTLEEYEELKELFDKICDMNIITEEERDTIIQNMTVR